MRSFYPFLLAVAITIPLASASGQEPTAMPTAQAAPQDKTPAQAAPEEMPVTVRPSEADTKKASDADAVMGVPALPKTKTSMIGGKISKIDMVHNKIGVKIFGGGGQWEMAFDERTHFFRD